MQPTAISRRLERLYAFDRPLVALGEILCPVDHPFHNAAIAGLLLPLRLDMENALPKRECLAHSSVTVRIHAPQAYQRLIYQTHTLAHP